MSGADVSFDYKKMRTQMRSLAEGDGNPAGIDDYLRFYGFANGREEHGRDGHAAECHIGRFESQGKKLAAYIFRPAQYKATVIILHGYLNHSGLMRRTAEYLLGQGYAVAMFDLPGHGLSEGRRAAIEDFSQYGCALEDFLNVAKANLHGPYHIVAHSTGASAVMEYLLTNGSTTAMPEYEQGRATNLRATARVAPTKIVLVAPLVRCGFWRPVQVVRWLLGPMGAVPRIFVKNSSNRQYLAFILFKDPLTVRTISIEWMRAMNLWASRAQQYPASARQVKIIQGDRDMTVDWRYNIGFIRGKFAGTDVTMIEGGDHELLNESDAIRGKVYECISEYLQE